MELSSRQIIALAAPIIVTYLTWSTLQGQMQALNQVNPKPLTVPKRADVADGLKAPLRDPFVPLTAEGLLNGYGDEEDAAAAKETLTLNATVIVPAWKMAVINGERVYEGQRFRGLRVQSVEPSRVMLAGDEGDAVVLPLRVAIVVEEEKKSDDDSEFYEEIFPGYGDELASGIGAAVPPGLPPGLAGMLGGPSGPAGAGFAAQSLLANPQGIVEMMMGGGR